MRIVHLTADYPPRPWSGIGRSVETVATSLARRGHRVEVLVADDLAPRAVGIARGLQRPPPQRQARDVTVHRLDRRRLPIDPRGVDWLHLHSLRLAPLALALRDRFGLRLAVTVHTSLQHEKPHCVAWCALQRRLLRSCDHLVLPSRHLAEEVAELLGTDEVPWSHVPHGVPVPSIAVDANLLSESVSPLRSEGPLVFAGRPSHAKGGDLALAVLRRFAHRTGGAIVAGGIRARDDRDGVHHTGWLDRARLERLFAAASLVLVPSRYEPFGLVAAEAQAVGAPILAADVGGLREVVADGGGGLRLGDHDVDTWCHTVAALLDDPARRARLARRGPRAMRRRFCPERAAKRLESQVYRREIAR